MEMNMAASNLQRIQMTIAAHFRLLARRLRGSVGIKYPRKCVRWAGYVDVWIERIKAAGAKGDCAQTKDDLKRICAGKFCKVWSKDNIIGKYYYYENVADWLNHAVNCIDGYVPNDADGDDRKGADATRVYAQLNKGAGVRGAAGGQFFSQPEVGASVHNIAQGGGGGGQYFSQPGVGASVQNIAQGGGGEQYLSQPVRGGNGHNINGGNGHNISELVRSGTVVQAPAVARRARRRRRRRNTGLRVRQPLITIGRLLGYSRDVLVSTTGGQYMLTAAVIRYVFGALSDDERDDFILSDFCNHSDINRVGQAIFSEWTSRYSPSAPWLALYSVGSSRTIVDVQLGDHILSLANDTDKHFAYTFIVQIIQGDDYDNDDNIYILPPPGFGMRRVGYGPQRGQPSHVSNARQAPY